MRFSMSFLFPFFLARKLYRLAYLQNTEDPCLVIMANLAKLFNLKHKHASFLSLFRLLTDPDFDD